MSQYVSSYQPDSQEPVRGSGMAVAALVLAILGLLTAIVLIGYLLAIVAIILAIISLVGRRGGRGKAIAALVISGVTILLLPVLALMAGIMLPALAKARQSARMIKSSTQMRTIVQSMQIYANANSNQYPPEATWQQTLMNTQGLTPEMFTSPLETRPVVGQSYVYIRPKVLAFDAKKVILYEVPGNYPRGTNVAFEDGSVQLISYDDLPLYLPGVQVPQRTR